MTALLVATLIVLPGPSESHTADDLLLRYETIESTRTEPIDADEPVAAAVAKSSALPSNVERYRGLAQAYFHASDVDWALRVIDCESDGNPVAVNPSSGAAGLFQHLPVYWAERASAAGIGSASDPFDASANFAVASWLLYEGGGSSHWNASKTCWG